MQAHQAQVLLVAEAMLQCWREVRRQEQHAEEACRETQATQEVQPPAEEAEEEEAEAEEVVVNIVATTVPNLLLDDPRTQRPQTEVWGGEDTGGK